MDSDEHATGGHGHADASYRQPSPAALGKPVRPRSPTYAAPLVIAAIGVRLALGIALLVASAYHRVSHDLRGPAAGPASSPGGAARDVMVVCGGSASGPLTATVTIVNHGSDAATYLVGVDFADGSGTSIGGGSAQSDALGPGASATLTVTGIAGLSTPSPASCTASDVIRTIARS